jgi:hypothetical protein
MTTTTTEPRLRPHGPVGASLAPGVTTERFDSEDSYIDVTKARLAYLRLALEYWTPDRPEMGPLALEILDDMARDHSIMRVLVAREQHLREATP